MATKLPTNIQIIIRNKINVYDYYMEVYISIVIFHKFLIDVANIIFL